MIFQLNIIGIYYILLHQIENGIILMFYLIKTVVFAYIYQWKEFVKKNIYIYLHNSKYYCLFN